VHTHTLVKTNCPKSVRECPRVSASVPDKIATDASAMSEMRPRTSEMRPTQNGPNGQKLLMRGGSNPGLLASTDSAVTPVQGRGQLQAGKVNSK
jgi:hypothetical protein